MGVQMNSSWPVKFSNDIFRALALSLMLMPLVSTANAPPRSTADNHSPGRLTPEEFKRQEEWRSNIAKKPQPKKGCFTTKYPSLEWQEIPCVNGPDYPMPPRIGI